jgi:ferredoxin-NADP reductase
MSVFTVRILKSEFITPDVKRFVVTKPPGLTFEPGQGCMLAIDQDVWRDMWRAFTFTSLPEGRTLEFIVKIYNERQGVTQMMGLLRKDDMLLLKDVFGTITYKGPGTFFAAGAGITPFISIFRDLHKKKQLKGCTLIYSNRTVHDVILDRELSRLLGKRYLNIFTRQNVVGFQERRIDRDLLITLVQDFDQYFYICGPQEFVNNLNSMLITLGATAESLVFES